MLKIIRNDDVAHDTDLGLLKEFCELCDEYGYQVMQAITLMGNCIPIDSRMDNNQIFEVSGYDFFKDNGRVVEYLLTRKDIIAVHGMTHTHQVLPAEVTNGSLLLKIYGLKPTYFVPPFNERSVHLPFDPDEFFNQFGLKYSAGFCDRIETWMDNGTIPQTEIGYLHSWRFANRPYNLSQLRNLFEILKQEKNEK